MAKKLPDTDANKHGLLEYRQLPEWRQGNKFITASYRPISHSYKQCLSSLTFLHTETGGQYTHFLPFLLATAECVRLVGILYGWIDAPYNPRNEDVLVFGTFFLGAFTCMGLSTTYHMFMSHSEAVATFTKQFDFLGIVTLIWGSLVPTIYYTFTCEVPLMRKYLITVRSTLYYTNLIAHYQQLSAISLAMAVFLMSPLARHPWSAPLRTPGFVALSASGIVPLAHGIQIYGWHHMSQIVGIELVLAQAPIYGLGLLCLVVCILSPLESGFC